MVDGRDAAFPLTSWSSIVRGAQGDSEARKESLKKLLSKYWRPIYASVRCGWGVEPAEVFDEAWMDLVSEQALERLAADDEEPSEAGPVGIFRRVDVAPSPGDPTEIAAELELGVDEVRSRLLEGRRRFRRVVAALIQDYAVDERDAREELRWTLG